jgi:hypothetical protein
LQFSEREYLDIIKFNNHGLKQVRFIRG